MIALNACIFGVVAMFAAGPVPVILDTDIGDDIDDTWALAMLLGMAELDVKLVVTATEDTPARTRLLAKMLSRLGRTDVAIGTGVKTGDGPLNQMSWLGDYSLSEYEGKVHEDGVGEMIRVVKTSPTPVTLIVIGPQTNIKAALERDPAVAENARVVTMAGSVYVGYNGSAEPSREWNVMRDVEAARAVFAAPWEITMAPLDLCGTLILDGKHYAAVEVSDAAPARVVMENYRGWRNYDRYPQGSSSVLFDTSAIYLAQTEALCDIKTIKLKIDSHGMTVPDESGRPVRCALSWKDEGAFKNLLADVLTRPQDSK